MNNGKNIFHRDYFDNYFKRHIPQWQSTKEEVLGFIKLDTEYDIIAFINKNRLILRPDGTTKNLSFLVAAKDSNLDDPPSKELLILKLIKYADEFYEQENNLFYTNGMTIFLAIKELLNSFKIEKKIIEVINKALNDLRSYHILCALIHYYDRKDIEIINDEEVANLKIKYLQKLNQLDCSLFSKVKNVLDVLYRWRDWNGGSYEEPKKIFKKNRNVSA